MKWQFAHTIVAVTVIGTGCEDYRLVDEKEGLKGEWRWAESYLEDVGSWPLFDQYLNPQSEGFEASIKFEGRNKLFLYSDGEHVDCDRIKFTSVSTDFSNLSEREIEYGFEFNGKVRNEESSGSFYCWFNKGSRDTLYLIGYPFVNQYSEGSAVLRYNKYVRMK